MPFNLGYETDYQLTGAGMKKGSSNIILGYDNYEDNLKIGRFAKVDAGRLDNLDGSATPVLAGVILRTSDLGVNANEEIVNEDHLGSVSYVQSGLVTVNVKTGETPAYKGTVYASNAGSADDGLAQAVATNGVDTGAVFIEEIKTGVWLIDQK